MLNLCDWIFNGKLIYYESYLSLSVSFLCSVHEFLQVLIVPGVLFFFIYIAQGNWQLFIEIIVQSKTQV